MVSTTSVDKEALKLLQSGAVSDFNQLREEKQEWVPNLQCAILRRASLRGVNLERADLRWADLQRADLAQANLEGSNFKGACLLEVNLWRADLFAADLEGIDLLGTNLEGAEFRDANLTGVRNLRSAKRLGFCILGGARISMEDLELYLQAVRESIPEE